MDYQTGKWLEEIEAKCDYIYDKLDKAGLIPDDEKEKDKK